MFLKIILRKLQPDYVHNKKKNFSKILLGFSVLMTILVLSLSVSLLVLRNKDTPVVNTSEQKTEQKNSNELESAKPTYAISNNSIAWPVHGQAAIGIVGHGSLAESNPGAKPIPMASLAKLITVLNLLERTQQQGDPADINITITAADEAIYNDYVAINGSVALVKAGSTLTLEQIIQAMLIRSANNLADTAMIWAFGDMNSYLVFANDRLPALGLNQTNVADSTGFSPKTQSTPKDLVLLGELAMQDPLIKQTVGKWSETIPVAGEITNTNNFLDFEGNGVIGVKTGDTDEAGGTYIAAAKRMIKGQEEIILVAILGGENHFSAQQSAMPLIDQVAKQLNEL